MKDKLGYLTPYLILFLTLVGSLIFGLQTRQLYHSMGEENHLHGQVQQLSAITIGIQANQKNLTLSWALQSQELYDQSMNQFDENYKRLEDSYIDPTFKNKSLKSLARLKETISDVEMNSSKADLASISNELNGFFSVFLKQLESKHKEIIAKKDQVTSSLRQISVLMSLTFFLLTMSVTVMFFLMKKWKNENISSSRKGRFLKVLMSSINEGILLIDSDFKVILSNKKARDLLDMETDRKTQQTLESVIPELFLEKRDKFRFYSAKKSIYSIDDLKIQVTSESGVEKWVSISTTPISSPMKENKYAMILRIRDITDVMKSYELMNNQNDKIKRTAQLAAVGEVATNIAHEINNPLAVIMAKAEEIEMNIARNKSDPEKISNSAGKIVTTVEKISEIIKGVKTLARDESSSQFEERFINDIINDSVEMCKSRFKHDLVDIETIGLEGPIKISCFPIQLTQVFINLVVNGVHATKDLNERWIKIEAREEPHFVEVWVTDSGQGIPEHVAERLFEAFYTTKSEQEGTGLGMSISKSIIEDHGGQIHLDSECTNTRFVIRLPKVDVPAHSRMPPVPKTA